MLRWLFPDPPTTPPPADLARPGDLPATLLEAAAQSTLVLPDPSAFRPATLAANLADGSAGATRAAHGPGLPVAAVLAIMNVVEPHQLVDVLAPALLAAPAGQDLDMLLERLRWVTDGPEWDTPAGHAVREACELRELELSWLKHPRADEPPRVPQFMRLLRPHVQAAASPAVLSPDLLAAGVAADVVDRLLGSDDPGGPPLIQQHRRASTWADADAMIAIARRVADAARNEVISDLRVVLAAQVGTGTIGGGRIGPTSWYDLADVRWTAPSGLQERVLDHVMYLRVPVLRPQPDRLDRLVAAAREWVARAVDEHRAVLDPHRTMADYDRFALAWWHRLGVRGENVRAVQRRRWPS